MADVLYTFVLTILLLHVSGSIIMTTFIPFVTIIARLISRFLLLV